MTILVICIIAALIIGAIFLFFNPTFDIYSKHHLVTSKKLIALTFDDGPDPRITPIILEVLRKHNIKATFFVVGKNVQKNPDILKRIYWEGHLIGNHSLKHNYQMFNLPSKILKDVKSTNQLVFEVIKKYPIFYRPPFGLRSFWGARILNKNGFKIITWNNMTGDYWGMNPVKLVLKITSKAKEGGIIVLHDGSEGLAVKNRTNLTKGGLEQIIEYLKSENFQFITLDKMFNSGGYRQND